MPGLLKALVLLTAAKVKPQCGARLKRRACLADRRSPAAVGLFSAAHFW